jgi:spore coat protein U-like protein
MKTMTKMMLVLVMAGASAFAGTVTSNMTVSATVSADCRIDSVGAMNFGTLGIAFAIAGTNATSNANVGYTCVNTGAAPTIRFGQGSNAASGSTDAAPLRRMMSGSNYISYGLYSDAGHSTVWNNTTGLKGTANGTAQTVTVYGLATAANVPAGSYSDTVVVSVDF